MNSEIYKSNLYFRSIWYEGAFRYFMVLLLILFSALFPLYLIVKGLINNGLHLSFAFVLMILAEIFVVGIFIWQFKTIFRYTSPFYTTQEGIVFTQFFNKKTILWNDVLEIDLDSSVDVNFIIGKQTRDAIILALKDGKQDYVLKNKAYKNIDEFIAYLKTNFPEKIKDYRERESANEAK